jgi:hypothetical protein
MHRIKVRKRLRVAAHVCGYGIRIGAAVALQQLCPDIHARRNALSTPLATKERRGQPLRSFFGNFGLGS